MIYSSSLSLCTLPSIATKRMSLLEQNAKLNLDPYESYKEKKKKRNNYVKRFRSVCYTESDYGENIWHLESVFFFLLTADTIRNVYICEREEIIMCEESVVLREMDNIGNWTKELWIINGTNIYNFF